MAALEAPAVAVPRIADPSASPGAGAATSTPSAEVPPPPTVGEPVDGAAPEAATLLEAIPAEMTADLLLPLAYRLAQPAAWEGEVAPQRVGETPRATSVLLCAPFYKPISRCVGGRR